MKILTFVFAATVLSSAMCSSCSDYDRVQVDFRRRVDVNHPEKPQAGATLNVAIASMISPNETIVHYQTFLEYRAAKTNRKINLVQRKAYAEINELLANGGIDLAVICSRPNAANRGRYHFEALAVPQVHQKSGYQGYLITGQDNPITRFEDLRCKQ